MKKIYLIFLLCISVHTIAQDNSIWIRTTSDLYNVSEIEYLFSNQSYLIDINGDVDSISVNTINGFVTTINNNGSFYLKTGSLELQK
jgi:hypothetical protein